MLEGLFSLSFCLLGVLVVGFLGILVGLGFGRPSVLGVGAFGGMDFSGLFGLVSLGLGVGRLPLLGLVFLRLDHGGHVLEGGHLSWPGAAGRAEIHALEVVGPAVERLLVAAVLGAGDPGLAAGLVLAVLLRLAPVSAFVRLPGLVVLHRI